MQAERINIFSCLTSKNFCLSDKGNECVSQIWTVKWLPPACLCTNKGGFQLFVRFFSQSPSNVFLGLVHMYILQNSPCFSALNPSFPYEENVVYQGLGRGKVQLQIITFCPADQDLDYKSHQCYCLPDVLTSLPFCQDITLTCRLETEVLLVFLL